MSDIPVIGGSQRQRLDNRRYSITETISFVRADGNSTSYDATVGFDALFRPREIFLFGAKDGSDMSAVLIDTAVALSVALQHGVTATAMANSVSKVDGLPASVIGAALDLLAKHEADVAPLFKHEAD